MRLYDLHTHTTMSDGRVPLEQLVELESELGNPLGVSDHLFICGIYTLEQAEAYLEALRPYQVYRGVEANMEQDFSLPEKLETQLDYVIASVHSMPDGRGGFIPLGEYFGYRSGARPTCPKNYAPALAEEYLTHTLKMTEHTFATQRVDIYGHCTVLPPYENLAGTAFLLDWENELLSLCKRYGVALEISGLWEAPHLDMILRAKAMGLTFSSGSDCHTLERVGAMGYVRRMAEEAGLTEQDFYVPQRNLSSL